MHLVRRLPSPGIDFVQARAALARASKLEDVLRIRDLHVERGFRGRLSIRELA